MPYTQAGQWGYLRVLPVGDRRILPLNSGGPGGRTAELPQERNTIPISMLEIEKGK
jgi:hypothetical protein